MCVCVCVCVCVRERERERCRWGNVHSPLGTHSVGPSFLALAQRQRESLGFHKRQCVRSLGSLQPAVNQLHLLFLLLFQVTACNQAPGCPAPEGLQSSKCGPGITIFYDLRLAMALCAVLQISIYPRTNRDNCQRQISYFTKDMLQNYRDSILSFAHIKF